MNIVAIIMITWGILEIILFFKIWGMTNNIKNIKRNSDYGLSNEYKMIRAISNPTLSKNDIENMIYNNLYDDLFNIYYSIERSEEEFNNTINYYKKIYDKCGLKYPSILTIDNVDHIREFVRI